MKDYIRIAGATGFWGESAIAVPQLLAVDGVDFLIFDYLSEVRLSIMAAQKVNAPGAGFVEDFVSITLARHLKQILERGIRVVSNAGGLNPMACVEAIQALAQAQGLSVKLACVLGDDLMHEQQSFREEQRTDKQSGARFPDQVLSINACLGATPIAQALDEGAQIVITGRCVESALALGALMHAFGWHRSVQSTPSSALLDCYAQGSLAGHLIKSGAQCSGGLFTDWQTVPDWRHIGYPVFEVFTDGSFEIFKPPGSGGLLSPASVAEQLLDEVLDPGAIALPDVVCDWTRVSIRSSGLDRVRVEGAIGCKASGEYSVSLTAMDGWHVHALLVIGGEQAQAKALKTAEALLGRTARMLEQYDMSPYAETHVEVLGSESIYGNFSKAMLSREVVLKLAVKSSSRESVELFAREFAPAATAMAPGSIVLSQAQPLPSPVIRFFSFMIDKKRVRMQLMIDHQWLDFEEEESLTASVEAQARAGSRDRPARPQRAQDDLLDAGVDARISANAAKAWMDPHWPKVPLIELAYARSAARGSIANIGVIARQRDHWAWLLAVIDESMLRRVFAHRQPLRIRRYPLPGIHALNLVLEGMLGAGIASLHTDKLGKANAQVLLSAVVPCPVSMLQDWRPRQESNLRSPPMSLGTFKS